jgi:protease IV
MTLAGVALALVSVARGPGAIGFGARIAVIEIDGVIGDDEEYLEQIRRFRRDGSVRGYVVSINSPGGVVGPSQSLFRELKRLREDGIPVVAAIRGVGASGGYYIAAAADTIFTLPGSMTGSIGVIMQVPDASELLDRFGVRVEAVRSAEFKDAGSVFRPLTPEDRELLEGFVNDVF